MGTVLAAALAFPAVPAIAAVPSDVSGSTANYSSGQPAPVTNQPPASPDTPVMSDGYGPTGDEQQAMQAAAGQARSSGKPVVVNALTTPVQQVAAQPDGGFALTATPDPVRTRRNNHWVAVNTGLHRTPSGSWSPKATAYGSVSFSGGGSTTLVTSRYDGVTMTVKWPAPLPAPVVDGTTATYRSVLPSVDLVLTATASGGFADTLVVKSVAAAKNSAVRDLELATSVSGGKLAVTGGEGLTVRDRRGRELMTAATPQMWDSNTKLPATRKAGSAKVAADPSDTAHPGLAARVAPVRASATSSRLALRPDTRLLSARSTVYPVYIDPSFNWHPYDPAAPAYDEVKQGCPNSKFYNDSGSDADGGRLGVGYNAWPEGTCGKGSEHAVYQWKLSSTIFGATIYSATVEATEVYSASCSGDYTVNLHASGGLGSGTDWNNRPKYSGNSTSASFGRAWNPDLCPSQGSVSKGISALTPIRNAASGHATSFTATLAEDSAESSHLSGGFSRFSHDPALQIEYDTTPAVPSASGMSAASGSNIAACDTTAPYPFMGKTLASTPPVLRAKVSDKDGDKLQATFQYWVDGSGTKATGKSGDDLSSGSTASFGLPASFVKSLTDGTTVDWQADVTDGKASTTFTQSPTCHFTAEPTAPDAPTVASADGKYPDTDNGGGAVSAAGTAGTFTLTGSGGSTPTEFVYSLDVPPATSNPPAAEVKKIASGTSATVTVAPPSPGPHTLWVYAADAAGDDSGTTGYSFLVTGDKGDYPHANCTSLADCYDNVGISSDSAPAQGNLDGDGNSFSATDLTNAGWASGGKVTVDGATFQLPSYGAGKPDNILAANQTIPFSASGNALEFLAASGYTSIATPGAINGQQTAPYTPAGMRVSGTYCFDGTDPQGPCPAEGTVTYTDGSTKAYYLTVPDWTNADTSIAAVTLPHVNTATTTKTGARNLYAFSVPLDPSKTVASVTLPDVSEQAGDHTQTLHVFSMATRETTHTTPEANGTAAKTPSGQSWTGAWADPTEGQYNFQGGDFSNQTFRIALKPSLSGGTLRVKLDNALGTGKLSIGHATVATDSGSGTPSPLPTGTPTTLKFGGSQSVTVPAGGSVYSDPLTFPVTAGQYLLVSYQLSNDVPYLVQHSFANNAYEYLTATGAGDKTTDTTGTPFAQQWQGWYTDLVTNLDITSSGTPTQAVLGDGLIDAFQPNTHPVTNGSRVSDALAAAEPTTPSPYGTIAEGIESNSLMTDNPQTYQGKAIGGPSVLSRIDRDILDQPAVDNVIVTEGLEDLLAGTSGDDLEANGYTALIQQLQGWGITSTLASLTPCEGYAGDGATPDDPCTADVDAGRQDVNAWLDSQYNPWDPSIPLVYYADFNGAVAVTDATTGEEKLSAKADTGDHANLTNTGYAAEVNSILSPHDAWPLDDGPDSVQAADTARTDTPSTVDDSSVGSSPLTLNGATTWTDDPTRGEALTLDGTTADATAAGQVLDTTGSYSVSAWVNLSSLPTHNATVASQPGSQNSPFYLKYDTAHTGTPGWSLHFTQTDTAGPTNKIAYVSGATAGAWTHLVGTFDATTDTGRLYVDGSLAATVTGITPWASTGPFTVGSAKYNGAMSDYFPGTLSDVQAWNYTLGADQVTALYDQIP
ncbi:LamG-like jellyroll fold domain-containing protein [Streptomyces sp. HF10]|uniref:LamG-like jellyroll fold domain-containing protein n=1 Tax=Streptomyces sp. HF10 TaxID=2692233 RepID=UPI0022A8AF86|nr:LamG-like jellyroll fold domain-containing protein [Streptomyces sp. HF10]